MGVKTLALILVVMLLLWLLVRRRQAQAAKRPDPLTERVSHKSTEFHAVSIRFESNACKAARELEGRRFLSSAAPRLPLPECNVLECNCRFVHHKDRRSGRDRRSPFGPGGIGGSTGKYEQEQRTGSDRRKRDDEELY
ncbi:MAG: hypothetical protein QNJ23_11690 [Woeseiaceae bacterium]|nr:hypothetical protein [Woeseiaceae bacterium]